MLAVARENPDGFLLLTGHAVREPEFASYHDQWWATAVGGGRPAGRRHARRPGAPAVGRPDHGRHVVEAVQAWLGTGDPARDPEFVAMATDGLAAMVRAWGADRAGGRAAKAAKVSRLRPGRRDRRSTPGG